MLTLTSCQTCPIESEEFLTVTSAPVFVVFNPDNPELKKILNLQLDMYYWNLEQLISMKETGMYVSGDIDELITIYQGRIDWIKSVVEEAINPLE